MVSHLVVFGIHEFHRINSVMLVCVRNRKTYRRSVNMCIDKKVEFTHPCCMCMHDEERKRDKSMFILYRTYIKLRSNFKYVDIVYLTIRFKR